MSNLKVDLHVPHSLENRLEVAVHTENLRASVEEGDGMGRRRLILSGSWKTEGNGQE
jgi:hypothetical protein